MEIKNKTESYKKTFKHAKSVTHPFCDTKTGQCNVDVEWHEACLLEYKSVWTECLVVFKYLTVNVFYRV